MYGVLQDLATPLNWLTEHWSVTTDNDSWNQQYEILLLFRAAWNQIEFKRKRLAGGSGVDKTFHPNYDRETQSPMFDKEDTAALAAQIKVKKLLSQSVTSSRGGNFLL